MKKIEVAIELIINGATPQKALVYLDKGAQGPTTIGPKGLPGDRGRAGDRGRVHEGQVLVEVTPGYTDNRFAANAEGGSGSGLLYISRRVRIPVPFGTLPDRVHVWGQLVSLPASDKGDIQAFHFEIAKPYVYQDGIAADVLIYLGGVPTGQADSPTKPPMHILDIYDIGEQGIQQKELYIPTGARSGMGVLPSENQVTKPGKLRFIYNYRAIVPVGHPTLGEDITEFEAEDEDEV